MHWCRGRIKGNRADMQNVKIFAQAGFFNPELIQKAHMLRLNPIYDKRPQLWKNKLKLSVIKTSPHCTSLIPYITKKYNSIQSSYPIFPNKIKLCPENCTDKSAKCNKKLIFYKTAYFQSQQFTQAYKYDKLLSLKICCLHLQECDNFTRIQVHSKTGPVMMISMTFTTAPPPFKVYLSSSTNFYLNLCVF